LNKSIGIALLAGLVVVLGPGGALAQPQPDTRIVAKTADDLPRHTYKIDGKPSEFILSGKPFMDFAAKVKADAESDLAKYRIDDPTTMQGYYQLLGGVAILEGRDADVLSYIEKGRALESKESKKLTAGLVTRALIEARKSAGADREKFNAAFRQNLARAVKDLPWTTVRETITQIKGQSEILSKDLILGEVGGRLDPVAAQAKGELSNDLAWGLIRLRVVMDTILPVNPIVSEVLGEAVRSHEVTKADVWTPRLVTLSPGEKATPVVAAIWDSGVDVSLYSDRLWTNPKEIVNGKDDDGNGFVDDVHGIAYDLRADPTPDLLHPLTDLKSDKELVASHIKGVLDLEAAVDSPEAAAFKKYVSALKPDQVTPFIEDLGLFGNYSHGTHVAGIAAEGNPFVRLLPVRITFDYKSIPQVTPSIEQAEKDAKAAKASVAYMKGAGARVCNMSWGNSRKGIEGELEKKGVGKDAAERAELSRKIFKIQKDALEEAMKSAPEILFIAAAGNSDDDNQFSELIPSGLNVPNMLTVGAVDQSAKPTDFTTFGKNVVLYANGFEVESYIPGGKKLKFSGTSMAAPNTTNLAAKLIAINPKLTTVQVIELIRKGADPMEGYEGRFVIDPKKTVELARKP
jgi:subtilisin family serine protease